MKINEVIYIDSLPKLDLHGYDRETARVAVNDFINDNIKMGNEVVNIVHGIGTGIIREATINTLNKNKNVVEYKSVYNNRGCVLVQLKL